LFDPSNSLADAMGILYQSEADMVIAVLAEADARGYSHSRLSP
jgi:hypothetical protein